MIRRESQYQLNARMVFSIVEDWERVLVPEDGGPIVRRVTGARVFSPQEVRIVNGRLEFLMTSMEEPSPIRPATRPLRTDLLERFAVLGRQSDSAIAKFARTWGPLGLCRHGLPEAHGTVELHLSHVDTGVGEHCLIDRPSIPKWTCQESLDEWREYSKRANAVLNAIAGIRENRRTQADPWQFLGPFVTRGEPLLIPARREIDGTVYAWTAEAEPIDSQAQHEGITWPWTLPVADQRALIAERLQEWLFLGDVRPMVAWSGPEPEFILAGKELVELDTSSADSSLAPIVSLFAAIAVQLVQAVHRIDPPAICSHCGKFYSPERRPALGRRRYCPECGKDGWPQRDSARDHRRRSSR